jgi:hypothetical protein
LKNWHRGVELSDKRNTVVEKKKKRKKKNKWTRLKTQQVNKIEHDITIGRIINIIFSSHRYVNKCMISDFLEAEHSFSWLLHE